MPNNIKEPISHTNAKSFPFQTSIACWVDLLGYGEMISQANFNPLHPKAKKSIKRLRIFHDIVSTESNRNFPTLIINDGAIAYRDLSYRSPSVTYDFLKRSWKLFNAIQKSEKRNKYAGARMVIATGFRVKGRRNGMEASSRKLQLLLDRLKSGEISPEQAIQYAYKITPDFDIIPKLQSNYAFTKAYLAESSGSAGGLAGAQCFVETNLFTSNKCNWIELGDKISWRQDKLNLEAEFFPIINMGGEKIGRLKYPHEICSGLEVAQELAGDKNVLKALRLAQKP